MQTGVDGCGWVWWGAGGTGGQENKTIRAQMGDQDMLLPSMTGEFPPNIMFGEDQYVGGKNGCGWVQKGSHGWLWTHNQRGIKNKAKVLQIIEKGMFYSSCTRRKKTGSWQRWSWLSDRIMENNDGQRRHALSEISVYVKNKAKSDINNLKKSETSY